MVAQEKEATIFIVTYACLPETIRIGLMVIIPFRRRMCVWEGGVIGPLLEILTTPP